MNDYQLINEKHDFVHGKKQIYVKRDGVFVKAYLYKFMCEDLRPVIDMRHEGAKDRKAHLVTLPSHITDVEEVLSHPSCTMYARYYYYFDIYVKVNAF